MDTLCLGFHTLAIVLGALKEDLGKPKEALRMVFGICYIRVFSQLTFDL